MANLEMQLQVKIHAHRPLCRRAGKFQWNQQFTMLSKIGDGSSSLAVTSLCPLVKARDIAPRLAAFRVELVEADSCSASGTYRTYSIVGSTVCASQAGDYPIRFETRL